MTDFRSLLKSRESRGDTFDIGSIQRDRKVKLFPAPVVRTKRKAFRQKLKAFDRGLKIRHHRTRTVLVQIMIQAHDRADTVPVRVFVPAEHDPFRCMR